MRITIGFEKKSPGIRIIPEIIDGKIVWIRGYNGIGKSMSGLMLEIASGTHHFNSTNEFRSLQKALGPVEIECSDNEILLNIRLEPGKWKLYNESLLIDIETLGKFQINKVDVSPTRFTKSFQTKILKGNETLSSQIQELITKNSIIIKDWSNRSKTQLKEYLNFRDNLFEIINIYDINNNLKNISDLEIIDEEYDRLIKSNKEVTDTISSLEKVYSLSNNINLLNQYNKSDLKEDIKNKYSKLQELTIENSERLHNVNTLRKTLNSEIEDKSNKYEKLVNNNNRIKDNIIKTSSDIISELNSIELVEFDDIIDTGNIQLLKKIHRKINQDLNDYEDKIRAFKKDAENKRTVVNKISSIKGILESEKNILYNYVIAEGYIKNVSYNIKITIEELEALIKNRDMEINNELDKINYSEYEDQLINISNQFKTVKKIEQLINLLNNQINSSKSIQKEILNYENKFDTLQNEILKDIKSMEKDMDLTTKKIDELKSDVSKLTEILSIIESLPDIIKLSLEKQEIINELRDNYNYYFDESKNNPDILDDLKKILVINENKLSDQLKQKTTISLEIERNKRNIIRTLNDLKSNETYSYLLLASNPYDDPTKVLNEIKNKIDKSFIYLENITNSLSDLSETFDELSKYQQQKGNFEKYQFPKIGQDLENIFNNYLLDQYNRSDFLNHVFRGYTSVKEFNLKDNSLILTSGEIEETRPISAFSSGEKAFAFSLAMMSIFLQEKVDHKILFLDEFGALLDHIKEFALLNELKSISKYEELSKIAILLPIKRDLVAEIENLESTIEYLDGKEKEKVENRINVLKKQLKEINERGYYQTVG